MRVMALNMAALPLNGRISPDLSDGGERDPGFILSKLRHNADAGLPRPAPAFRPEVPAYRRTGVPAYRCTGAPARWAASCDIVSPIKGIRTNDAVVEMVERWLPVQKVGSWNLN